MSYNVVVTSYFKRQSKRLIKKYASLANEIVELIGTLEKHPKEGDNLGNSCYKIRLSIAAKGKGKSGGARIITHVQIAQNKVYLLAIYDKSECTNLSSTELDELLRSIC